MRILFLIFGVIGLGTGLGFAKLAIQGIVDPDSVKIFPQATFFVGVVAVMSLGILLIGLARVFAALDQIEKRGA